MTTLPAVQDWTLPELADLSERLARVTWIPKAYRGKPDDILAVLLMGQELGLGRMRSLLEIHLIEGSPTLSAAVERALVQAAGHTVTVEATGTRAVAKGHRKDGEPLPEVVWDLSRAATAGLVNRSNWKAYPQQMLVARASAEFCRTNFSDVIFGLTTEEAEDLYPNGAGQESPPVLAPPVSSMPQEAAALVEGEDKSTQVQAGPAEAWVPPLLWEEPPEPEHHTMAQSPQLLALHAQMRKAWPNHSTDQLDRFRHTLAVLTSRKRDTGPVLSSKELTPAELDVAHKMVGWVQDGILTLTEDGPWVEVSMGLSRYRVNPDTGEWHTWQVPE